MVLKSGSFCDLHNHHLSSRRLKGKGSVQPALLFFFFLSPFKGLHGFVSSVLVKPSWALLPYCLWAIIVSYLKFKDFLFLYMASKLLSTMDCKYVIWQNLRMCDVGSRSHKQFIYILRNKIKIGKIYIPKLEFYNYISDPYWILYY